MDTEKWSELENRIKALEEKLNHFSFDGAERVNIQGGAIGDIYFNVSGGCEAKIEHCSIGMVFNGDLDEADGQLDDLESRLEELNDTMDEAENRLDAFENRLEEFSDNIDEAENQLEELND